MKLLHSGRSTDRPRLRSLARLLTIASLATAYAATGQAQSPAAQKELLETLRVPGPYHPANTNNQPGLQAAAVDGDTLALSAMSMAFDGAQGPVPDVGAVYVFERTGSGQPWQGSAVLRPSDPQPGLAFGREVQLDGDTLVVGAIGAVYVFERSGGTWSQSLRLTRSPLSLSVSLDGDRIALGEWATTVQGHAAAGRIDIYERVSGSWGFSSSLFAPTPDDQEGFGKRVDISGNTLVAYCAELRNGLRAAAALVFDVDSSGNWSHNAELRPNWLGNPLNTFRLSSIDLERDDVVIQDANSMAIFQRNAGTWRQTQTFDKRRWGFLGNDRYQQLRDGLLVVSSYRRAYDGPGHVTLVFRREAGNGRYVRAATLTQSDGYAAGVPVVGGDTAVVVERDALSACLLNQPPTCGVGAAYIYDLRQSGATFGSGCAGDLVPFLGVRAVPDLIATGELVTGGALGLHLDNARPNSIGVVAVGAPLAAPLDLGGGCSLHVSPDLLLGPIDLGGFSEFPGSGAAQLRLPLPIGPRRDLAAQALVLDAASNNGVLTTSRAVRLATF